MIGPAAVLIAMTLHAFLVVLGARDLGLRAVCIVAANAGERLFLGPFGPASAEAQARRMARKSKLRGIFGLNEQVATAVAEPLRRPERRPFLFGAEYRHVRDQVALQTHVVLAIRRQACRIH